MADDTFTEAYKKDAIQMLKDSRDNKTMGSRSSNTAAYADARATALSLTNEASTFILFTFFSKFNYFLVRRLRDANGSNGPCITC